MTVTRPRIRIGISACLLGDEVRYDGGHKRDAFLADILGPFVEWVKVCPEVEIGMGTPREPIRLTDADGRIRLMTVDGGVDHTDAMTAYAARRTAELAGADLLCGYVLKQDSPSCGMARVKVYGGNGGPPSRIGVGLFAAALLARFSHLPLAEEGGLADARRREHFVERAFAYRRLRDLFESSWTAADLVRFHTAHKFLLLAHSTEAYSDLGRLVAAAGAGDRQVLRERYSAEFMAALAVPATPQRHTNVLQHMVGYFKDILDDGSRAELLVAIDDYRQGLLPLAVPVTLLRHHVRQHAVTYLSDQVYLAPHPDQLALRNQV